jgi:hypothetical protein
LSARKKSESRSTSPVPSSTNNEATKNRLPAIDWDKGGQELFAWLKEKQVLGSGPMSQELRRLHLRRRHSGVGKALSFLGGISGINSQGVVRILDGSSEPYHDVFDLHCEWALAAETYHHNKERRKALIEFSRQFRKVSNLERRILESPLFSDSLKNAFKVECQAIKAAVDITTPELDEDNSKPIPPFTVSLFDPLNRHKSSDWSRQGFWTPIISALRTCWHKSGKTNYRAFKDIAHLLAACFPPFPDDANLVKRRYLHSLRK